ncbi:MAG TPA: hypothetical protein VH575_06035 [Gemmataceae bacterium]
MALPPTKTSGSARTAVLYITLGAILDVWTITWFFWMIHHGTSTDTPYFWCYGLFFTGLVLIVIGLTVGHIGRVAQKAEEPANISDNKAAQPPISAPPQLQQPLVPPAVQTNASLGAAAAPVAPRPSAAPGGTAPTVPPPSGAGTLDTQPR